MSACPCCDREKVDAIVNGDVLKVCPDAAEMIDLINDGLETEEKEALLAIAVEFEAAIQRQRLARAERQRAELARLAEEGVT